MRALDGTGLQALWERCKAEFAAKPHTHTLSSCPGTLELNRGGTGATTAAAARTALGAAASGHLHDASHLVSGTLDAARLPAATAGALGAVKVGAGLAVADDGTLSSTGDSASMADHVVAQGTCDFWGWRMWASGVAECWGETGETTRAVTSAWGALYESASHHNYFPGGSADHPFSATAGGATLTRLFASAPAVCHVGFRVTGGGNVCGVETGGGRTALRTEAVFLLRPTSASVTGRYAYHAFGRWM